MYDGPVPQNVVCCSRRGDHMGNPALMVGNG